MTRPAALRVGAVAMVVCLGACDDALMARRTPPPADCARRGGTWQAGDTGHTGHCTLPPGARVAGWTIMPRRH
ncbi:hypothetical protein KTQ54_13070 [Komagataeibacter oboediens]|uniref:hypothetical protein n=1 Tax=Komagataeibacter oboediens TaxID=65958 RepID=UPI001C2B8B83|nr:hypothetical protein [Komagataeibacter oboediens]MBV0889460.1 hypothetical protein [Komagataeibacter oboediens]MCK9818997.1 hypothetical protein [Komagataeibacter oboediens]